MASLGENFETARKAIYDYEYCLKYIVNYFSYAREVSSINQQLISSYISNRLKTGRTRGARVIKELKALRTVLRWKSIHIPWRVPIDETGYVPNNRRDVSIAILREFIEALPCGSIERAYAILKIRSGLREVELRQLIISDLCVADKSIRFTLKNKKRPIAHSILIDVSTTKILMKLCEGRSVSERLFSINGHPLRPRSLRNRWIKASRLAGIEPPITSLGFFRHIAITLAANKIGLAMASRAVGHMSEQTTSGYMLHSSLTAQEAFSKALSEAIPL